MRNDLPELSRFELQCLRRLWGRKEASVRDVQADFPDGPGYSTFRKIFERLEAKGAIQRVRREGRAWLYRSNVSPGGMIRKEIRRLIDGLFDGRGGPLLAHLADMDALTMDDLKAVEEVLKEQGTSASDAESRRRRRSGKRSTRRAP